MASYLNERSKVSSEAITGDGDLVSAVAAGRATLENIEDEDLPEDIGKLPPDQRKAKLNKQTQQRKSLNETRRSRAETRWLHCREKRNTAPARTSSFDSAVEKTLKAQTKRYLTNSGAWRGTR